MMGEPDPLKVERPYELYGYLVGFRGGGGTWFYTPEEPPEGTEKMVHAGEIDRKSKNFPTKDEAIAFGRGFEKGRQEGPDKIMGNWKPNNSDHDYHWHRFSRDDDRWKSIWVDKLLWGTWEVEIYPIEEGEKVTRRSQHETMEQAAQKVADLMEKYD
jgi:hypothetical protein